MLYEYGISASGLSIPDSILIEIGFKQERQHDNPTVLIGNLFLMMVKHGCLMVIRTINTLSTAPQAYWGAYWWSQTRGSWCKVTGMSFFQRFVEWVIWHVHLKHPHCKTLPVWDTPSTDTPNSQVGGFVNRCDMFGLLTALKTIHGEQWSLWRAPHSLRYWGSH